MNNELYCRYKCEFYQSCGGNIKTCVIRTIKEVLQTLTPKEEYIIINKFGLFNNVCCSRTKIARHFFLSAENIKQSELKAMRKLRHPSRSKFLAQIGKIVSILDDSPYTKFLHAIFGETIIFNDINTQENDFYFSSVKIINSIDTPISEVGFSPRIFTSLIRSGFDTAKDIINCDLDQLRTLRIKLSKKNIVEILMLLDMSGFRIKGCEKNIYPNIEDYILEHLGNQDLINDYKLQNNILCFDEVINQKLSQNGINSTKELLQKSRKDLYKTDCFLETEIQQIVAELNRHNYKLKYDTYFYCNKCGKRIVLAWNFEDLHFCDDCIPKVKNMCQISDLNITLFDKQYTNIYNKPIVELYANIINRSSEALRVETIAFYSTTNDKIKECMCNIYDFEPKSTVIPPNSKHCCGIMLANTKYDDPYYDDEIDTDPPILFDGTIINENDTIAISLSTQYKIYKFTFVYDGHNWGLDDYKEA